MDINQVWPGWQTEKLIGKGSYGNVYKCFRFSDAGKEYSAVKVISIPQDDADALNIDSRGMSHEQSQAYFKEIADDFLNEIKILESLKNVKNVVEIQDSEIVEKKDGIGWQIFIRMELLTDFNTYTCDRELTADDVKKLALDLCGALEVCAEKKIIHRDIKPENIFIDSDGNFKLGDFGVAKQMEKTYASMSTKGTYNYMAPEILAGKKYDSRVDIYSLGLVMYRLLNNDRLPFLDRDKQMLKYSERQEAFERRVSGERIPPIPDIDEKLNEVVLKACEFRPDDRYSTVAEFKAALEKQDTGGNKAVRFVKKHKAASVVAAVLILAIVSGSVAMVLRNKKVKPAEESTTAIAAEKQIKQIKYKPQDFYISDLISYNGYGIICNEIDSLRIIDEKTGEEIFSREIPNDSGCYYEAAFDGETVFYTVEYPDSQVQIYSYEEESVIDGYINDDGIYLRRSFYRYNISEGVEEQVWDAYSNTARIVYFDDDCLYFTDIDEYSMGDIYSISDPDRYLYRLNLNTDELEVVFKNIYDIKFGGYTDKPIIFFNTSAFSGYNSLCVYNIHDKSFHRIEEESYYWCSNDERIFYAKSECLNGEWIKDLLYSCDYNGENIEELPVDLSEGHVWGRSGCYLDNLLLTEDHEINGSLFQSNDFDWVSESLPSSTLYDLYTEKEIHIPIFSDGYYYRVNDKIIFDMFWESSGKREYYYLYLSELENCEDGKWPWKWFFADSENESTRWVSEYGRYYYLYDEDTGEYGETCFEKMDFDWNA